MIWRSFVFAFLLALVAGIYLTGQPDFQYGDSGLMAMQTRQFLSSGGKDLSFQYRGRSYDPNFHFIPFQKPFLGKVGERYFIDFPPYFVVLSAPALLAFGSSGLFLPGLIALFLTLIALDLTARRVGIRSSWIAPLVYFFCSGTVLYNHVYHETPLAQACLAWALYSGIGLALRPDLKKAIAFGFFGGLALFFRMEAAIFIMGGAIALIIYNWHAACRYGLLAALVFIALLGILLLANLALHDHPLGLRYTLTVYVPDRIEVIHGLLFSKKRGLFFQTPIFALAVFLPVFMRSPVLWMLWSWFIVVIATMVFSMPNHGDHIAPRYLFSGLLPGALLIAYLGSYNGKARRYVQILAALLAIASTLGVARNMRWLQNADRQIAQTCQRLSSIEEEAIFFSDYGWPLNLQCLYDNKLLFVIPSGIAAKQVAELHESLKKDGKQSAYIGHSQQAPALKLELVEPLSAGNNYYIFSSLRQTEM